jgi:hypothetical protein
MRSQPPSTEALVVAIMRRTGLQAHKVCEWVILLDLPLDPDPIPAQVMDRIRFRTRHFGQFNMVNK